MSTPSESAQFLRGAWSIITRKPIGLFSKVGYSSYMPRQIYESLGYETSIDELIQKHHENGLVEKAVVLTVDTLKRDWNLLSADSKRDLIGLIGDYGMADRFHGLPKLSTDDLEALKIRWDISDLLFSIAKKTAFKECEKQGLNMHNRTFGLPTLSPFQPYVTKIIEILSNLVRTRAETDIAVVSIAVQSSRYKYQAQIRGRMQGEFLSLLEDIRQAFVDFLARIIELRPPPGTGPYYGQVRARDEIEPMLEPFKAAFEKYSDSIEKILPSSDLYEKARKLIGEPMQNVYNITGDGTVIDNKGTVVSIINKQLAEQKSQELAEAFAMLKAEISQLQKVNEKTRKTVIRALEDAEDEAADKEPKADKIEEPLQRAKTVLEESGAIFDQAEGWGLRLVRLAKTLAPMIPTGWHWLKTFLG